MKKILSVHLLRDNKKPGLFSSSTWENTELLVSFLKREPRVVNIAIVFKLTRLHTQGKGSKQKNQFMANV